MTMYQKKLRGPDVGSPTTGGQEAPKVIPLRHPGRWIAAGLIAFVALSLLYSVSTNPRFRWDVVGEYLFAPVVLDGLLMTLEVAALSMAVGVILGAVLAVMSSSANRIVSSTAWAYVWFFRATPVLVQLLFLYFFASLYPTLALGVPFMPPLAELDANRLITPLFAVVVAFGLNEAAYMCEIYRGGIASVGSGQVEAAKALGLQRLTIMRRIVLPQAMKVVIPPTANQAISMVKATSIALVIGLPELMTSVQIIYSRNYLQIPLLIVACLWYLLLTSVLTVVQHHLERRFTPEAHSDSRSPVGKWSYGLFARKVGTPDVR